MSPEGHRGPGRLDVLQGGSLKDAGAGCPHVPQDESTGKTTGLAEQVGLLGLQKKMSPLLTEERAGDSRGVQGSH